MTPPTVEELFKNHSLAVLAPEIALTLFAIIALLAGTFVSEKATRRVAPAVALLGVAASAFALVPLWGAGSTFGFKGSEIFVADNFSLFFKWIFLLGLAVSVLLSGRFLTARHGDRHTVIGEYYGLLMLSTVGMMIVASASDLLTIFLGIETMSIALYVLAGFARARLLSNEAALKYFLLGAFATGFLLYGIALTYFAVGSTHLATIAAAISAGSVRAPGILYIGIALLLIGLGFKAAFVPFHQWTPDVYEGSPTPVTAFMAVGAKAAAFAALMRVLPGAFGGLAPQWKDLVLVLAVLTMTVGNVVALTQPHLKRTLAYSSIAHAGYLLVGVLASAILSANANALRAAGDLSGAEAASLSAAAATAAVLFYLLTYAIMNLGAFSVLVTMEDTQVRDNPVSEGSDEVIRIGDQELSGLASRQPAVAFAMSVFLLSLAGIPPLAGFFGKFFIFTAAVNAGLLGLVIVGVLNSVISVYYYLRPIVTMYASESRAGDVSLDGSAVTADGALVARPGGLSISLSIATLVCVVAVLGMIVLQSVAWPIALQAAQSLQSVAGG